MKQVYDQNTFKQLPKYSVKKTYDLLVAEDNGKVMWDRAIWCRMNVPKHRFICWLVACNRLQTKVRLGKMVYVRTLFV